MWLSKKIAETARRDEAPLLGSVTLSGAAVAAQTDAEWRNIAVCGPGGYHWRPRVGSGVLVLKDPDGRRPYAVAALPAAPPALAEGEILIEAGRASIRLTSDGAIRLTGDVFVNDQPLTLLPPDEV